MRWEVKFRSTSLWRMLVPYSHRGRTRRKRSGSRVLRERRRWRHRSQSRHRRRARWYRDTATAVYVKWVESKFPVDVRVDVAVILSTFCWLEPKPIDNKPSHWVLPPGHWRLKLKICRLFHANRCKFDAEIKSYKDGKTIWFDHNHYLQCTLYIQQQTLPLCVQLLLLWSRSTHFGSRRHVHVIG